MAATTSAYTISVFTRSSLAVAALPASEQFHTSASALGALVVFQVMVYALMQIPVGVLLDRFGPRILLIIGALFMTVGQVIVAQAVDINVAYLGRMLVGIGDSATFVSMIRLIQDWNQPDRAGRLQLMMTNVGQSGQVIAAIPFAFVLGFAGWQNAFNIAAIFALLSGLIVFLIIRTDAPAGVSHHHGLTFKKSMSQLWVNLKFPGARMCFWMMFVSQSSGTVFALFWGVPFLIKGQGQTAVFASTMLLAQFVIGLSVGWLLGRVIITRKHFRIPIFLGVGFMQITAWIILSAQNTEAPTWLLYLVIASISIGAPASMIAMDISRTIIPPERRGSGNGFINVGGHAATFIMMAFAGWALDIVQKVTGSNVPFTFTGFRWAMATQVVVLVFGLVMFAIEYRKTRLQAAI
ncbi:MAG: hypothetical protein RL101_986 [Actinomycetota bacterium]|jgi:MFS family permease